MLMQDRVPVRHVLASVADKTGLEAFAGALPATTRLFATGGTYDLLSRCRGPELVAIEAYTGHPEMPGGLVKTLHPRIHGGLLAEAGDAAQDAYLETHGIIRFDLVLVNLYPFERTVADPNATLEQARRQIDIGGPTMLRAGAKNFARVAVVVDPADYPAVLEELDEHDGCLGLETRWRLASKAFAHVAAYDRAIAHYFEARGPRAVAAAYGLH